MAEEISDVFISYAHLDDVPMFGEKYGWVRIFYHELKKILPSRVGDKNVDIWIDDRLAANDKVTDTLVDAVRNSRILLLFLSKGYLNSPWCQKELGTFLEHNQAQKNKENVFIVELDPMEATRDTWHPRMQELTPIRFWKYIEDRDPIKLGWPTPNPNDPDNKDYWFNLNSLTNLIAERLNTYSESSNPKTAKTLVEIDARKPAVWIAEPTEDLIDDWESLAEAVRQAGYNLLPVGPETYPRSSEAKFCEKFKTDLESAQLYVQLLGKRAGRKPEDGEISFTTLQNNLARELAQQRKITFLQWRNKELILENIADESYRQLLTGANASGFEEFRQRVLSTLKNLNQKPSDIKQTKTPNESVAICISADKPDQALCNQVRDILVDLGADALITPTQVPGQLSGSYLEQLNEVIGGSEGVIIIYGESSPLWVQAQYNQAKKALLGRQRKGIWGALLDGPPHKKSDVGIASKNLMMLNCRDGAERQLLEQFVNSLREDSSHA